MDRSRTKPTGANPPRRHCQPGETMIGLRSSTAFMLVAGLTVLSGCAEKPEAAATTTMANTKIGGDDRNGEYVPVAWMKNDPAIHKNGIEWGQHSGVSAVDPNRVFDVTWGDM